MNKFSNLIEAIIDSLEYFANLILAVFIPGIIIYISYKYSKSGFVMWMVLIVTDVITRFIQKEKGGD